MLTRELGQAVWIGDVKVTLVKRGSRLRLVIDAPPEVLVLRDEIKEGREAYVK